MTNRAKILLAIGNYNILKVTKGYLKKDLDFQNVYDCDNGNAALNMLETSHYDLVIAEWNLPDVSAIEFLRKIREKPEPLSKIPFIIIKIGITRDELKEALEARTSDIVVELSAKNLWERINRSLSLHKTGLRTNPPKPLD